MSAKKIRKAIASAAGKRSTFETGTVVRWVGSGRFTYAAILCENGAWYTTSRAGNPYVAQTVTFDGLLEIISRAETTDVEIAAGWAAP